MGVFAGEDGLLGIGVPTKVTPSSLRQDWKTPIEVNSAVVGFCCASGMVAAVATSAALALAPVGSAPGGACPA